MTIDTLRLILCFMSMPVLFKNPYQRGLAQIYATITREKHNYVFVRKRNTLTLYGPG